MKITLKLFATFRRHLPTGSEGHACDLEVAVGTSVADVLTDYNVPTDSAVLLVNGRTATLERVLEDDDVLAVFPALAGG